MDRTAYDNELVKRRYADARSLGMIYKIRGYPSYLFFTPDGQLVLKDLGYKGPADFINMVQKATDPHTLEYYTRLKAYQIGKKDYAMMGRLAVFAKNEAGNYDLALNIAIDYKENYLDKLSEDEECTRENLDFIDEFPNLINSKDKIFDLCYNHPEKIDQAENNKSWAKDKVEQTITTEELGNKLAPDGKPIMKNPNWNKLRSTIIKKYAKADVKFLVLDYQVNYYWFIDKNWRKWALYQDQKIKAYKLDPNRMNVFFGLNMPAWNTFLNCTDKKVLAKALEWSDLSIKLEYPNPNEQYLDTRANLLYKLGRIREAIAQEEKAVEVDSTTAKKEGTAKGRFKDEFLSTVAKMKKQTPTWY